MNFRALLLLSFVLEACATTPHPIPLGRAADQPDLARVILVQVFKETPDRPENESQTFSQANLVHEEYAWAVWEQAVCDRFNLMLASSDDWICRLRTRREKAAILLVRSCGEFPEQIKNHFHFEAMLEHKGRLYQAWITTSTGDVSASGICEWPTGGE